jgi:hypothetical protein
MDADLLEREWGVLARLLPPGWRESARSTGALRRSRGVRDADSLLRLILLHVATGLSLQQAAARARRTGLADVSAVALFKRLRGAGPWLQMLARQMLQGDALRMPAESLLGNRRVRVVDATTISEPGSSGTDWRLHYVVQLPSLECDFFEVTDPGGGETFRRLPVESGDVVLGDRGYCHREGVAHIVAAGGDAVVRLNSTSFPLHDIAQQPIALLPLLRALQGQEPGSWPVLFRARGRWWRARLCAIRKSSEAASLAKTKIRKLAAKKGKRVQESTLEAAEFIFVLATDGLGALSAAQVLELYRARWQIELVFKRMKSLFNAGHVPKYDAGSAQAWLHAKLLAVLLIERLSQEARSFSPWGFPIAVQPVARVH